MVKRVLEWNRSTVALAVIAGVLVVEVIGYVVMTCVAVAVPSEYLSLMVTTLTVLAGVAGAQYTNGKIAHSKM